MKFRLSDLVQRELNYAIVDEVDSILVDEARTPLIISGPTEESTASSTTRWTTSSAASIRKSTSRSTRRRGPSPSRRTASPKRRRSSSVTNLYDLTNMDLVHAINQSLKAHHLFKRDVDYMVKDGKVVIVDEFTGRLMPGRRYSDGLHQALEAKEKVRVEEEYQTLASITFQNYFRMYKKLAGMTGTAVTEATEFHHIYKLDVVEIPTNQAPHPDRTSPTSSTGRPGKNGKPSSRRSSSEPRMGRPVLVGTISIEKSEHLSTLAPAQRTSSTSSSTPSTTRWKPQIIAQAGRVGAVTIATNMAGRGVDILLGGNPEYLAREQLQETGQRPAQGHTRRNGRRPWPRP